MENEIFTSKDIHEISCKYYDFNDCLNAVADKLKAITGINMYFCEILGARWSFCAGDIKLDIPQHKIKISDNYGIMTGEICIPENQWVKILNVLRNFIEQKAL